MTPTATKPSDVVGQRLKQVRMRFGLKATDLAQRCATIDMPELTAHTLSNIETGRRDENGRRRRDVSVEELYALSYALNVSPLTLLTPENDLSKVHVTPNRTLTGEELGQWIAGLEPRRPGRPPFDVAGADWRRELPGWRLVELWTRPTAPSR